MQPTPESFQDTLVKSITNFKVVLQQGEDGGYIVSCPALPGCHSQGESTEEALENIKEAIAGCMQSLSEEGIKTGIKGLLMEVTA
jgi:predicted RNase H-like HicB family nuclease